MRPRSIRLSASISCQHPAPITHVRDRRRASSRRLWPSIASGQCNDRRGQASTGSGDAASHAAAMSKIKLTPELLLSAYAQGVFPMAHDDGEIYWYSPDPRAILPLDRFHVPQSLRRVIHRGRFTVVIDSAFEQVISACAEPGPGRESTWISREVAEAYIRLHQLGFAHSVECWLDGELVGGLYGVSLRGLFAGESMFSRVTDASKVALYFLVQRLRERGFLLLDTQFLTPHLERFGAVEIPAEQYQLLLAEALSIRASFG